MDDILRMSPSNYSWNCWTCWPFIFNKIKACSSKDQKWAVLLSGTLPFTESTASCKMHVQLLENTDGMGYFIFCTFLRALETNKYNHITATYFLLAERILREKQEKEIQTRSASPSNIKAQFRWEFRNLNGWEGVGVFLFFKLS